MGLSQVGSSSPFLHVLISELERQVSEGNWSHFLGGLRPLVGDDVGREAVSGEGDDVALGAQEKNRYI